MILSKQAQTLIDEVRAHIATLPPDERKEALHQLTENIARLTQEMNDVAGALSSAKDPKDIEAITERLQAENMKHISEYL